MQISAIIISAAVVAGVGLCIGIVLGLFGKKFEIEQPAKEIAIREALPGNNCGGCGYPGCDGAAHAVFEGIAPVNVCPVGGKACADQIAAILGVAAKTTIKKVAFVKCHGTCDVITQKSIYSGITDCSNAVVVPGGAPKECRFGCWGFGSCVNACNFHAIRLQDGVAVVNPVLCTGCGKCVATCPNHIIELVPYDAKYHVACMSHEKGKDVMAKCKNGCIGCGLCSKQCDVEAITLHDNLASIDYEKCVSCGKCAEKCPKHIIM